MLARMRIVVGYIGEREQHNWWQSSFYAARSRTFLSPIFGRTHLLAQCTGVSRAAALVHDEHIGIGRVYHLFRLPEEIEQGIHTALRTVETIEKLTSLVSRQDAAMQYLRSQSQTLSRANAGPIEIGSSSDIRDRRCWRAVAATYFHAFDTNIETYPYFTDHV
jgi:hypothetical protein